MAYVKHNGASGQILLNPILTVGNDLPLTIDTVFYLPHDNDYRQEWHTLARDYYSDHFALVNYGRIIGFYDNRNNLLFRHNNFDISTLGNGWHHICVTLHPRLCTQKIWFDGVLRSQVNFVNVRPVNWNIYSVLNFQDNNQSWYASKEFRVWHYEFTEREINSLLLFTKIRDTQLEFLIKKYKLLLYFPFDEPVNSTSFKETLTGVVYSGNNLRSVQIVDDPVLHYFGRSAVVNDFNPDFYLKSTMGGIFRLSILLQILNYIILVLCTIFYIISFQNIYRFIFSKFRKDVI